MMNKERAIGFTFSFTQTIALTERIFALTSASATESLTLTDTSCLAVHSINQVLTIE